MPYKISNLLPVVDKSTSTFKEVCLSAGILSIASMGDTFLYAYLPVSYQHLGITSFWVGVILSVNRVARFFLNGYMAWIVSTKDIRKVVAVTLVLASLSSISYGWISVIPLWILARILWGICFSMLRLSNTLYALQHPQKGIALGLSKTLAGLGSISVLLLAPLLLRHSNRTVTFSVLGVFSLGSVLFVLLLSDLRTEKVSKKELILSSPSYFSSLVLINAFIAEGVLVVLLSRLVLNEQNSVSVDSLMLVGLLLGYRRLSLILFSPLAGWLADKWGFNKVFSYTSLLSAAGLLFILSGATLTGIVIIFTFSAMNATVSTGAGRCSGNSILKTVSDNSTWRDIGAAAGAFIGSLLLSVASIRPIIIALVVLYAFVLVLYYKQEKNK